MARGAGPAAGGGASPPGRRRPGDKGAAAARQVPGSRGAVPAVVLLRGSAALRGGGERLIPLILLTSELSPYPAAGGFGGSHFKTPVQGEQIVNARRKEPTPGSSS